MSRTYIKTSEGKDQVAKPKVRVFENIEALETALENNEVDEGEIVSTKFVGSNDISIEVEQLFDSIEEVSDRVGSLEDLSTEDNTSIVNAINEVKSSMPSGDSYYTKTETDDLLDSYYTKTETDATIEGITSLIPDVATSENMLVATSQIPVYTFDSTTQTLTITFNE